MDSTGAGKRDTSVGSLSGSFASRASREAMMLSGEEENDQQSQPGARDRSQGSDASADSHDDLNGRPVPARQRDSAEGAAGADGADVAEVGSTDDVDEDGRPGDVVDPELVAEEAAQQLVQIAMSSSAGPLPPAEELHNYHDDERERIFRMAEAYTTDESARRDKIVDSSTKVAARAQWIMPALLIVAFGFAFASYAAFENVVLSGAFLSIPVMQVIGSSVRSSVRARQPKRSKPDDGA